MAAWCYAVRKASGWLRGQDLVEATRLARRAAALGRDDAVSLCFAGYSLGYVVGELDDAIAFIDKARALNSNLASAWYFSGWMRIWLGEPEQALEDIACAMRLSPLDPFIVQSLAANAHGCFFLGRYDEAMSWAVRGLRERPD